MPIDFTPPNEQRSVPLRRREYTTKYIRSLNKRWDNIGEYKE